MADTRKIPPEDISKYRQQAIDLREQEVKVRYAAAVAVARKAVHILKDEYEPERVLIYGPVVQRERFDETSGVNLAVWGLAPDDVLRARATLQALSDEIAVRLEEGEILSTEVLTVIQQEGEEI